MTLKLSQWYGCCDCSGPAQAVCCPPPPSLPLGLYQSKRFSQTLFFTLPAWREEVGLGKGMWAHSEIQIIFLRTLALPTVQIWALNTSRKSSWTPPPHTH